MRYFGLVGRVRGQKFAASHKGGNGGGGIVVVEPGSGKAEESAVLRRDVGEVPLQLRLAHRCRQAVRLFKAQGVGHVGVEIVERGGAAASEHGLYVFLSVRKIRMA